jgi:hypothetical protein
MEGSHLRSGGRLGLAAALFLLASSNLDNGGVPYDRFEGSLLLA